MGKVHGEDRAMLVNLLDACGSKGSDDDGYDTTKGGRHDRRWGRGRGRSLAAGAASIINRWPDHLTMCWLIAMGACMMTVAFLLMIAGAAKRGPSPLSALTLQQRCHFTHDVVPRQDKTQVYLHVILNEKEEFDPEVHRRALTWASRFHPNHVINIFVLQNDTHSGYERNSRFKDWELLHKGIERYKFFETSTEEGGLKSITPTAGKLNYDGLPNLINVNVVRSTFSNYFQQSPLKFVWKTVSCEMIPSILRILTTWEHGGISMPWQMFLDKTSVFTQDKSTNSKLHHLVEALKKIHAEGVKDSSNAAEKRKAAIKDIQEVVDFGGSLEKIINITSSEETGLLKKFNDRRKAKMPVVNINHLHANKHHVNKLTRHRTDKIKTSEKIPSVKAIDKLLEDVSKSTNISKEPLQSSESYLSYSSSESDGLPSSIESHSPEFGLKPTIDRPTYIQNEVKRFINAGDSRVKPKEQDLRVKRQKIDKPREKRQVKTNGNDPHVVDLLSEKDHRFHSPLSDPDMEDVSSEENPIKDLTIILNHESRKAVLPKPYLHIKKESQGGKPVPSSEYSLDYFSSSLDTSSESSSEENPLLKSSKNDRRPKKLFKEKNKYRNMREFDNLNVFSFPNKISLTMDRFGYYFSIKKPCHAFLGQAISILQRGESMSTLVDPLQLMTQALEYFCRNQPFNHCDGITLL